MSGSQGYVNDSPAAVDADSTNETNDSVIALLKAIKNLQIDLTELNVILAGAVSAGKKVLTTTNIDFSDDDAQTIIAAPGANKRIRLCQLVLMSGAENPTNMEIVIKSGTTIIKTVKGMSVVLDFPEHCNLGVNEALILQSTTNGRIVGGVDYYVEEVA